MQVKQSRTRNAPARKSTTPRRTAAQKREEERFLLLRTAARAAYDRKGRDIVALDVTSLVHYSDFFLLASATTEQHVAGLKRHIEQQAAQAGFVPLSVEGTSHNRWVLMDFGHVIVHLFIEQLRGLYELERLWDDAPRVPLCLPEMPPAKTELPDPE